MDGSTSFGWISMIRFLILFGRSLLQRCALNVAVIWEPDGGYVGLATIQHYPELFQNIDWGTERVAEQTLQRASELGLKTRCFASLPDIDRPEDLSLLKGETIGSDIGLDLDSNRVP